MNQHISFANPNVLLASALVMVVSLAISTTGWTDGLNLIVFVGVGTVLVSVMLIRSMLLGLTAHLFSVIIGVGWSFWVTSRLLPQNYTWLERWDNLATRITSWYSKVINGGVSEDNLMFIFQLGVIVWLMGYMTLWFLLRNEQVWLALLPGAMLLLLNLYYAPNNIVSWFWGYLLLSLLLIIRFNLSQQEDRWRAEGTFFRPDIQLDFLRDGLLLSVVVIGMAWLTPPATEALPILEEYQGAWRDVQREWNRLYADLNYDNPLTVDTFGRTATLGGPRHLTDEAVMDVQIEGIGRYWRAAVYDEYTGQSWRSNDNDTASFGPDEALGTPIYQGRVPVTQTYTFYRDSVTVLHAMSNPVWLDRTAQANFNTLTINDSARSEAAWPSDQTPIEEITYLRSNATVDSGEAYTVVSLASQASVQQLRQASEIYPPWITTRYLPLPTTVTERTRTLARELTAPYDNNFDRAQAIERYLRRNITYNERIPQPPEGVEKVDYIVFETQEAYCDYYASAMIVMLRSVNIPARFAAGYARGEYSAEKEAFHVVNADAHSWVEVYFPAYGWVEFEPTAAQPPVIRPTGPEDDGLGGNAVPIPTQIPKPELPDDSANLLEDEENVNPDPIAETATMPVWSLWLLAIGAGGLLSLLALGGWWWSRQAPTAPMLTITQLYARFVRLAAWAGVPWLPTQTPYEHADQIGQTLPEQKTHIQTLSQAYVSHTFGEPSANEATISHDVQLSWETVRTQLLKQIPFSLFRRG